MHLEKLKPFRRAIVLRCLLYSCLSYFFTFALIALVVGVLVMDNDYSLQWSILHVWYVLLIFVMSFALYQKVQKSYKEPFKEIEPFETYGEYVSFARGIALFRSLIAEYQKELNIVKPIRLGVLPEEMGRINAMSSEKSAFVEIGVTEAILFLSEDEMRCVILHELGHVVAGDVRKSIKSYNFNIIYSFLIMVLVALLPFHVWYQTWLAVPVILFVLLQRRFGSLSMRDNEYLMDLFAVENGVTPDCFKGFLHKHLGADFFKNASYRNRLRKLDKWFVLSHPLVDERIAAMDKYKEALLLNK